MWIYLILSNCSFCLISSNIYSFCLILDTVIQDMDVSKETTGGPKKKKEIQAEDTSDYSQSASSKQIKPSPSTLIDVEREKGGILNIDVGVMESNVNMDLNVNDEQEAAREIDPTSNINEGRDDMDEDKNDEVLEEEDKKEEEEQQNLMDIDIEHGNDDESTPIRPKQIRFDSSNPENDEVNEWSERIENDVIQLHEIDANTMKIAKAVFSMRNVNMYCDGKTAQATLITSINSS